MLTLPITSQYSFYTGFSIGDMLLIMINVYMCINLVIKSDKINFSKIIKNPFFWFILYIIINMLTSIMFQNHASMTDILTRSVRYIFYILCAVVLQSKFVNFGYFFKWYRRLVIFATVFLIIQVVFFRVFNTVIFGVIRSLTGRPDLINIDLFIQSSKTFFRPSSLFIEPGYYVQFVLPLLAFSLFGIKNQLKQNLREAIFISLGLILSTSGQGIIIGLFEWAALFFIKIIKLKPIYIIGGLVSMPILFYISSFEFIDISISRLFGSATSSSYARIFRGFDIFSQIEPIYKIIGVGYGNVGAYMRENGILAAYDTIVAIKDIEYMNSIAYILVNLGVIGMLIMIWILVYLYNNTWGPFRLCLCVLVLLSSVSTIFLYSNLIFYLAIILSGFKERNRVINNNIKLQKYFKIKESNYETRNNHT